MHDVWSIPADYRSPDGGTPTNSYALLNAVCQGAKSTASSHAVCGSGKGSAVGNIPEQKSDHLLQQVLQLLLP